MFINDLLPKTKNHEVLEDTYRTALRDIEYHLKELKNIADKRNLGEDWPVFKEPWFGKLKDDWEFLSESDPCAIQKYLPKNITEGFDTVCREIAFLLPETDSVKMFLPVLLISYFTSYIPYKPRTKTSSEQPYKPRTKTSSEQPHTPQTETSSEQPHTPQTETSSEQLHTPQTKTSGEQPYNLLIRRLGEQESVDAQSVSDENERIQSLMDGYLHLPSILEKYPKLTTDSFSVKNVSRVLPIYLQVIQFLKFMKATRSLCSYRACLWYYDQKTRGLSLMSILFEDMIDFLNQRDDMELLSHERQPYDEQMEMEIDCILDEFEEFIDLLNPEKLTDPENFPPSFWHFLDGLQYFLSENGRRGEREVNGFLGVLSRCGDKRLPVDEDETAEHQMSLYLAFDDADKAGLEESRSPEFVAFLVRRLEKYECSPNVSRAVYRAFEDCMAQGIDDVDTQEFEDFYIKRLMEYDQGQT